MTWEMEGQFLWDRGSNDMAFLSRYTTVVPLRILCASQADCQSLRVHDTAFSTYNRRTSHRCNLHSTARVAPRRTRNGKSRGRLLHGLVKGALNQRPLCVQHTSQLIARKDPLRSEGSPKGCLQLSDLVIEIILHACRLCKEALLFLLGLS